MLHLAASADVVKKKIKICMNYSAPASRIESTSVIRKSIPGCCVCSLNSAGFSF